MTGSPAYEELAVHETALGQLLLRRRRLPGSGQVVYEIKLDDDLLMSSFLDESERELARRALARVALPEFDVLVGGLGLGATAVEALGDERVLTLSVVELLPEVIAWHERGLVPLAQTLGDSPRTRILEGDFFALAGGGAHLPGEPAEGYGAILVDIDHAPDARLGQAPTPFYDPATLRRATQRLAPGGAFALWAAGAADERIARRLADPLEDVEVHEITVFNPMADRDQTDTLYLGLAPGA